MENVQGNNELIAKYLNLEGIPLNYDKSYSSLMLAVDKIKKDKHVCDFNIDYCSVFGDSVTITPNYKNTFNSIYFDKDTSINVLYKAVVAFIKWYNYNA